MTNEQACQHTRQAVRRAASHHVGLWHSAFAVAAHYPVNSGQWVRREAREVTARAVVDSGHEACQPKTGRVRRLRTFNSLANESALAPRPALYLVATPIGNLEDITLRALRILKEADVIACEDTRQTQKLLNHYGITTRTVSYHEHNEMTRAAELVKDLQEGTSVALVTDAGMPGISDPGYRLISLAIRHHVPVVPIPGVSAFLAALVASGLPTDSFRFSGFLPAKRGERRAALEAVKASPRTQVFYEAPHRIVEALADVVEVLGANRHVVIAREVTKLHEEFLARTRQ